MQPQGDVGITPPQQTSELFEFDQKRARFSPDSFCLVWQFLSAVGLQRLCLCPCLQDKASCSP